MKKKKSDSAYSINRFIIDKNIWRSLDFNSYTPEEKLVHMCIITCPENNILGIFQLSEKHIAFYTGLAQTAVKKALKSISDRNQIIHKNNMVIIVNRLRDFDINRNSKVGAIRLFKSLPVQTIQDILEDRFEEFLKIPDGKISEMTKAYNIMYESITNYGQEKPEEPKPEPKPEPPKVYKYAELTKKVIDKFPEKFRPKNKKEMEGWHDISRKLIEIDGYSEENILKAVDYGRNDPLWSKNFLAYSKLRNKNKENIKYIDIFLEGLNTHYEPGKVLESNYKKNINKF